MTVGATIPFRLVGSTPTIVFTKTSGDVFGTTPEEREPTSLVIVNTDGVDIEVDVEVVFSVKHFGGVSRYISKGHPVFVGDTGKCLLSDIVLREDDSLRVTTTGLADVFVYLEAPEEKRSLR